MWHSEWRKSRPRKMSFKKALRIGGDNPTVPRCRPSIQSGSLNGPKAKQRCSPTNPRTTKESSTTLTYLPSSHFAGIREIRRDTSSSPLAYLRSPSKQLVIFNATYLFCCHGHVEAIYWYHIHPKTCVVQTYSSPVPITPSSPFQSLAWK